MQKLKITRYKQYPGHCAIAACATAANFYNPSIDYSKSQEVAKKNITEDIDDGLDSGEIGRLLNHLGFNKVNIVSTNLHILDYTWAKLKKPKLIAKMKEMKKSYRGEYKDVLKSLYKWINTDKFDNNIIIDYDFGKHIRQSLDKRQPLVISFNWTMHFRYPKYKNIMPDDIKGDYEEHAVVAYGYNKKGVYICDSHHQCYKYRLKNYRDGLYNVSWEHLMTIMGWGDLYIPEDYE